MYKVTRGDAKIDLYLVFSMGFASEYILYDNLIIYKEEQYRSKK